MSSKLYGPYTFDALDDTQELPIPEGEFFLHIQVIGSGTLTLLYEDSLGGSTYLNMNSQLQIIDESTGSGIASITAAGVYNRRIGFDRRPRIRCSAYTSGSFTVYYLLTPWG